MQKIFLGLIVTILVILARFVFISDPDLGAAVTGFAALTFVSLGARYAFANPGSGVQSSVLSDMDGPNQGWDPRTIEAARRRADGME